MEDLFDEDFDPVLWLNKNLDKQNPEQKLSSLNIQLQLLEQDLENTLEFKSEAVLKDLEELKTEALDLEKETKALLQETEAFEEEFRELMTPEMQQLRQDYQVVEEVNQAKSTLQELEFFESKCSTCEPKELASLFHTVSKLEGLDSYSYYRSKLEEVASSLKQNLKPEISEASRRLDRSVLKSHYETFKSINSLEEFSEVLIHERVKVSEVEGEEFNELLGKYSEVIRSEGALFADVFDEPQEFLEKLCLEVIDQKQLTFRFLELNINDMNSSCVGLISLASYLKETTGTTQPIVECCKNISWELPSLEESYLRSLELGDWKQRYSRVFEEMEPSWLRCLNISLGTNTPKWLGTLETMLTKSLEDFEHYLKNSALKSSSNEWENARSAVECYEELEAFSSLLETWDKRCREEYLHTMTTAFFASEYSAHKELQDEILSASELLTKANQKLTRTLREGSHFFSKAMQFRENLLQFINKFIPV